MNQEIVDACVARIREADKPLALAAIRKLLPKPLKVTPKQEPELALALDAAPVVKWAAAGKGKPRYWHRTLRECATTALMDALLKKPITLALALKDLKPKLFGASKPVAEVELKALLYELQAAGKVHQEVLDRKVWYFSPQWAAAFAGQKTRLGEAIVSSVQALESGPGNYVAVYKLRTAAAVNAQFDEAAIALADAGELILSAYDGPRPVPAEKAHEFVQDSQGLLYVGLARPRREE